MENLEIRNKCLLKWLFKLLNVDGVWEMLLQNKYLHSKILSQVTVKPTNSPFWKGLVRVKDEFFQRGSFLVGNGTNTRFWEDCWLEDMPLSQQYPPLYNNVQHKHATIAQVGHI